VKFPQAHRLLSLSTICMLAACSAENISRNSLKVRTTELNLASLRGPVTVVGTDGTRSEARYFSLVGDSAMWVEPKTENVRSIPLPHLGSFVVHDHVMSTLLGGLAGIGVGAVIASGLDGKSDETRAGVLLGGELFGFLAGSLFSYDRTYVIDNPAAIPLPDTTGR
jgi:hypothetical protein